MNNQGCPNGWVESRVERLSSHDGPLTELQHTAEEEESAREPAGSVSRQS